MRTVADINWRNKTALLRADFNTPLASGQITDDSRIRASMPTARFVLEQGGAVVFLSHLGRPKEGFFDAALSLAPAAARAAELLGAEVSLKSELPKTKPAAGEVWMLENTRFNIGEKTNSEELAKLYAACGDVFVLDAFAAAHRREASVCALAFAAAERCGGMLLAAEIGALQNVLENPARPLVAVVGGGKISTKLPALKQLLNVCDIVIPGGGVANTFLAAAGKNIGASLCEKSMLAAAADMLKQFGEKIVMPSDFVVAEEISETAATRTLTASELSELGGEMILDIGEESRARVSELILPAKTAVWSGPLGVFECAPFAAGTRAAARAFCESPGYTLAGGGDTLAAVRRFGADGISYLSTGGGAFLEYLGGAELPALSSLAKAG